MSKERFELIEDGDVFLSVHVDFNKVVIEVNDGWDIIPTSITKEQALQLSAALVSAAKEVDGE